MKTRNRNPQSLPVAPQPVRPVGTLTVEAVRAADALDVAGAAGAAMTADAARPEQPMIQHVAARPAPDPAISAAPAASAVPAASAALFKAQPAASAASLNADGPYCITPAAYPASAVQAASVAHPASPAYPAVSLLSATRVDPAVIWQSQPVFVFETSLRFVAQRVRLPGELTRETAQTDIQALLALIDQATQTTEVLAQARTLSGRQLAVVFPALAQPGLAHRQISRLNLIIRERASQSLYHYGWHTLQQHYPCPPVARALTLLCTILEIKQEKSQDQRPGALPLITRLAAPNSRHWLKKLEAGLVSTGWTLARFIQQYQLEPDSALVRDLASQVFLAGPASLFPDAHELFGKLLQTASPAIQAELLRHFLAQNELDAHTLLAYRLVINRQLGNLYTDHPAWRLLNKREQAACLNGLLRAALADHFQLQPDKACFYLRYADQLRRVEHWDSQTLILYSNEFAIADCLAWPDQAIFYDRPLISEHPPGLTESATNRNPASSAIPHLRIEDALQRGKVAGIIQLRFDPEGIKLSGVLLDFALQQSRKHSFFH